jgi:hypothetical protein
MVIRGVLHIMGEYEDKLVGGVVLVDMKTSLEVN